MDATQFIKQENRMCKYYSVCLDCPVSRHNNKKSKGCEMLRQSDPEYYVGIVEKWSSEHSIKTRQSEFLKMFPNAEIRNGFIRICPKKMDQNSITSEECAKNVCQDCMRKYWLQEVD